jgi:hypothetical protein
VFSFFFVRETLSEGSFGFFLGERWIEGGVFPEFRRQFGNHPIHNRIELLARIPAFGAGGKMFS